MLELLVAPTVLSAGSRREVVEANGGGVALVEPWMPGFVCVNVGVDAIADADINRSAFEDTRAGFTPRYTTSLPPPPLLLAKCVAGVGVAGDAGRGGIWGGAGVVVGGVGLGARAVTSMSTLPPSMPWLRAAAASAVDVVGFGCVAVVAMQSSAASMVGDGLPCNWLVAGGGGRGGGVF